MIDLDAAGVALRASRRILIVTHTRPDGDAIGSLLGLGNALRAAGRNVHCAVDGGVPAFLQFLPGADTVHAELQDPCADLLIMVDVNAVDRAGKVGALGMTGCRQVINLDHHISNTGFGDIQLVMPAAVSTTEVVYYWLQAMELPLTATVAQPLLTGLVTDTLGFRTSNVTAQTLQLALALMDAGVSLPDTVARALEGRSWRDLLLWQRGLRSLALEDGVMSAHVSLEDSAQVGTEPGEDADLVNQMRATDEARIAIVYRELEDGRISLSLRSKPPWDVARVAQGLGGGGHAQAAGATIAGPLAAARSLVAPLLSEALRAGNAVADECTPSAS